MQLVRPRKNENRGWRKHQNLIGALRRKEPWAVQRMTAKALRRHKQGLDIRKIAKKLGIFEGEVIDLLMASGR